MKKIAVFASGEGTNAENICHYFKGSPRVKVALVCTNNRSSSVLDRVKKYSVPSFVFSKKQMNETVFLEDLLRSHSVSLIVLAGFLLKVPEKIVSLYDKRIINIHPSLLPKYGGKGMFGNNIHQLVIKNNEVESGITIHFVNNNYDEGNIICQKKCFLSKKETVISLSSKIHSLEKRFFPKIIEKIVLS